MRQASIFSILFGAAMITAALLHLSECINVRQVQFLAHQTCSGIICIFFGAIFFFQNVLLNKIRGVKQ